MNIKDNENLKLSLPAGSYRESDAFKTDYSGLIIKEINTEHDGNLSLRVKFNNNELHLYLSAKNEKGKEDLKIIENNKEKFIGKEVEKAIGIEL